MLKGLKKLFVYEDPSQSQKHFRFPEEPSESLRWDNLMNKKENSNDQNNQDNNINQTQNQSQNQSHNQTQIKNQNSSGFQNNRANNSDAGMDDAAQADVFKNLIRIMKTGQSDSNSQDSGNSEKKDLNKAQDTEDSSQDSQKAANRDTDVSGSQNSDSSENKKSEDSTNNDLESTKSNKEESSQLSEPLDSNYSGPQEDIKSGEGATSENKKSEDETAPASDFIKPCFIKPKSIEELVRNKDSKESRKKTEKDNNRNKSGKDNQEDETKDEKGDKKRAPDLKKVSTSLDENIKYLENLYNLPSNKDLIIRKFNIAKRIPACIVYIDGMIDHLIVVQFALPQLMDEHAFRHYDFKCECPLDYIEKNVLTIHQIVRMKSYDEINPQLVSGLTALFVDGCDECLVMESRGFERRGISPPMVEQVINGPQEGFTETLRTNITQIRRIVKSENLVTEFEFISKKNNFQCAIMYMEGIANRKVVDEVKRRVKSLDVDYISGSGMLEQLIEDKPFMIFPQIVSTERPDRAASFLMDGKVVIICEGTPFALAMPIVFFDLFHTSEESNLRWQYGSFLRVVRLIGLLLAAFLPGMYTALILFHQEMIPTSLLSTIVASRVNVPFPTIVEILLMEFSFELIREGGIRVPGVTGNTLGIIGALILGQAAVEAGLVSPILIIIVAVSGLGSFSIPNYSLSMGIRIVRVSFIIFAQIAGFYGISVAFTILFTFVLNLKSFGVPFFAPIAPTIRSNMDKIIRAPVFDQVRRPDYLNTQDEIRMGTEPRGWAAETKGGGSGNDQGR